MSWLVPLLLAAGVQAAEPPPGPAWGVPAGERVVPEVNVRPDERRSEKPFTVDLAGGPLELRLGYDLSLQRRRNFDLDRKRNRNRRNRDQELKADARWRLRPDLTAFVQVVAVSEVSHQPDRKSVV